jgi:hypothetical protein
MTHARRCGRCGASLDGLRRDALYCGTSCRTLAYRARRERRLILAAVAAAESRLAAAARGLDVDD